MSTPALPQQVLLSPEELSAAREAVHRALVEDLGPGLLDLTAAATTTRDTHADIVARQPGVLCGLPVAQLVFAERQVDRWEQHAHDGEQLDRGRMLAEVAGGAAAVLSAERVALNFLQRLSGIATLTRRFVDAVAGTGAAILDTRKTTPGLRALERYAVRCGGGTNHRFGLFDAAMVKDNHIDACGGIAPAVAAIRAAHPGARVIVETRDLAEVAAALEATADSVLLDNMDLAGLRAAVALVEGRIPTEASGGVTLATVRAVAETGVDFVSIGALTHSAPALDIALDVRR